MPLRALLLLPLLVLAAPCLAQEEVTFRSKDGVVVHADLYAREGRPRGAVLLFHQLGGNAGEYQDIAPRLAAQGFDALAVDQRLGGSMFGIANRTMAGMTRPTMTFDAVLPDLAAALAYARDAWPGEPLLLWGSSYSADLVVAQAADDSEGVAGVLAFSPVNMLQERDLLNLAAAVTVPVFLTYATADGERALAAAVAAAVPTSLATLDEPTVGVHGSLTLLEHYNPSGWEAEWAAVEAFLATVAP